MQLPYFLTSNPPCNYLAQHSLSLSCVSKVGLGCCLGLQFECSTDLKQGISRAEQLPLHNKSSCTGLSKLELHFFWHRNMIRLLSLVVLTGASLRFFAPCASLCTRCALPCALPGAELRCNTSPGGPFFGPVASLLRFDRVKVKMSTVVELSERPPACTSQPLKTRTPRASRCFVSFFLPLPLVTAPHLYIAISFPFTGTRHNSFSALLLQACENGPGRFALGRRRPFVSK